MDCPFLNVIDVDLSVCNHRYDNTMTYVEQTDTLQEPSATNVLTKAFSSGIRVGANIGQHAQTLPLSTFVSDSLTNGTLKCDYYFPAKNDLVSTEQYTENEFDILYESNRAWFSSLIGKDPSVLSYGYGNTNYSEFAKKYFLAGRNSQFNLTVSEYGKSFDNSFLGNPQRSYLLDNFISHVSTYRWYDEAIYIGKAQALQNLADAIDIAYLSGGLVTNFTHWHDVVNIADYDDYFSMLSAKNVNNDIHFCSYGEAVEYMVFRSIVSKVTTYIPRSNVNSINIKIETDTFDKTDILNTPLSIKFNLTSSILDGKTVQCTGGTIYSQIGNIVMIDVDYDTEILIQIFE